MNSENLGGILDKINELRALFIFGQRVIPFLEELFYFVHDIVPVLEEINVSINESANKMPRAFSQLNKVTKATEVATTEILDNLDNVISRLNAIDAHFETTTNDLNALDKLDKQSVQHTSFFIERRQQGAVPDNIRYTSTKAGSLESRGLKCRRA